MADINPFILKNYLGPEYFCDRDHETDILIQSFENQRNMTLFSNRKIGKTGLIYHYFHTINQRYPDTMCLYIDLFDTANLADFITAFSKQIAKNLTEKRIFSIKIFKKIFQSISPTLTLDPLTGLPQIEFTFRSTQHAEQSLDDIFAYLNQYKSPVVIAFDEFQQITHYPEKNMEAKLRTLIQNMHNVTFIFSGSHKHLMLDIFASAKRPFYQSTEALYLHEIPIKEYTIFIQEKMKMGKKYITDEAIQDILKLSRVHTYFVQVICNHLYAYPKRDITPVLVHKELENILALNEGFYHTYRELLPNYQWKLLSAIAHESEGATQIMSKDFINKYALNTQGTVQRAFKALTDKDMIMEKDGKYFVQDVFFSRWLEKKYL
ncbi:MAG: hypothetical protein NW207_01915 [Cytophagales bacterium]|nr:hypothetical protein [Cytophagales bacterium]